MQNPSKADVVSLPFVSSGSCFCGYNIVIKTSNFSYCFLFPISMVPPLENIFWTRNQDDIFSLHCSLCGSFYILNSKFKMILEQVNVTCRSLEVCLSVCRSPVIPRQLWYLYLFSFGTHYTRSILYRFYHNFLHQRNSCFAFILCSVLVAEIE